MVRPPYNLRVGETLSPSFRTCKTEVASSIHRSPRLSGGHMCPYDLIVDGTRSPQII